MSTPQPTRSKPRGLSRRVMFLLIVSLVFGLVMVYPPLRLATWLLPAASLPPYLAPLLFAVPFALRFVHERSHQPWSRDLSAVVMTWLGICFIALCLLLPVEILVAAQWLQPQLAATIVVSLVGVLSAYGIYNAQRLSVRTVNIRAPLNLRGSTIVQISDVHIGSRRPNFLKPIVAQINQLQPDVVVITGDLIDMRGITPEDLQPLSQIQAPCFFCIGNHERYVDVDNICARLQTLGIFVLRNQTTRHPLGSGTVQFIGIDDAESRSQVRREINKLHPDEEAYRILLYHRPDGAKDARQWGIDLMLTGHTHRGQIVPFNFLVKRVFPQYYLSYDVDGMHLYVSPGTGTWGPILRLGSKCEVTLFRLM